jgi:TRAP transporter 4TM/12TM fusion protein
MAKGIETVRFRTLHGPARWLELFLFCLLPITGALFVMEVPSVLGIAIFREQFLGLFLAFLLGAAFLTRPAGKRASNTSVPWYDWLLMLASLVMGLFIAVRYPQISYQLAVVTPTKWLLGVIAIVLVLEACRRLVGWVLTALVLFFVLYGRFGHLFPGIFESRGASWQRLVMYLYLDTNGMLGLPLVVAATVVMGFVLFGNVLFQSGGATVLTDFSMAAMGRFRGGPAKIAVVASSLFGSISGTAVSNVVMTGSVTIPLMKRTGYRPHVAAAIEAVASTGGQIMPPVMGVAAFIMAEFLAVPYSEVAIAALIPALLYYITVFFQVDLEAAKTELKGLRPEELPRMRTILARGWLFLVPLAVLIYLLFGLFWPAGRSALVGVFVGLALALVQRGSRLTLHGFIKLLESTGRSMLEIGVVCAGAGFIIGVLQLSGLGFRFSLGMTSLAGGNVFVLLVLVAIACIILGMGMPTAAVYILLAVLAVPGLVELGIDPLAAHLFVFYFGILSMITPPVCLATYAAAALAKSDFIRTAGTGIRLATVAYVVPFLFAFAPALILKGGVLEVVLAVGTAIIGAGLLGIALSGHMFGRLNLVQRGIFILGALFLLTPAAGEGILFHWITDMVGLGAAVVTLLLQWLKSKSRAVDGQAAEEPKV